MKKYIVLLVVAALLFPAIASAVSVKLTWVDNATNEDKFQVERSITGNTIDFAIIASPGANVVTYTDAGLVENVTYYYRVNACNSGGCSAYTPTVSVKTLVTIPATPTGLTGTPLP